MWAIGMGCLALSLSAEAAPPNSAIVTSRYRCGSITCEEKWLLTEGKRVEMGPMIWRDGKQVRDVLRTCADPSAEPVSPPACVAKPDGEACP